MFRVIRLLSRKGGAKSQIMTALKISGAMQKMKGDHVSVSHNYSVLFLGAPPLPEMPRQKFFLFTSLAAIFEVFSPEQIGCGLRHLYNLKVPDGSAFAGKRCIIKREMVFAKRQKPR